MSQKVIEGWGIGMVRLLSWQSEARLRAVGLSRARNATPAAWRQQFGSKARTWAAVEAEATELIAVHTVARLLETCFMYELVEEVS